MRHPQASLRRRAHDGKWESVEVDEKLAPFIKTLWAHGIDTMMSCQDNPEGSGRIWINFLSVYAAQRFLKLAVPHPSNAEEFPPESLYNRVYSYWFPDAWLRGNEAEYNKSVIDYGLWDWTTHLSDLNFVTGDEETTEHFREPHPWPEFDISVRFPFKDVEELTQNILKADSAISEL
jgi:hypothetical protein